MCIIPAEMAAGRTGETAELTFLNGGRLGYCHWNDTNAADVSLNAAAMQFVHIAAVFALVLSDLY